MTNWRVDKPKGRVFALVLWNNSYQPIPEVMQYDPPTNSWIGRNEGKYNENFPHSEVKWHCLPKHYRFDSTGRKMTYDNYLSEIITITTQEELDKLPEKFKTLTRIIIKNDASKYIHVNKTWDNAHVEAWDNAHVEASGKAHVEASGKAHVEAWGNAHVEARDNAHVVARGKAHVVARDNAHVEAWDNAHVVAYGKAHVEAYGAHVEAWGNAHVEARDKAHVKASDNAHVEAWDNAHVEARDNAYVEAWDNTGERAPHVVAYGNAHVEARDNAHVEAWDNAHVVARGKAHVEAYDSAHVEAWGNVSVKLRSYTATIVLFMCAVCIMLAEGKVRSYSSNATIIKYKKHPKDVKGWLNNHNIKTRAGYVTLYKRVSSDFKTQEGTNNETNWEIGRTLEHLAWEPLGLECGEGKFHACSRPFLCDQFRYKKFDKYVAIKVNIKDMYVWPKDPKFPTKVAFRKGRVLYECDRFGNQARIS